MNGRELQEALDTLGLSQSEAARRLGIDRTTLWRHVHCRTPVPGPVAAAVQSWLAHQPKRREVSRV